VERPADVPVKLSVAGGAGRMLIDGTRLDQKGGMTKAESPGWTRTKNRYEIEIVGGSKTIEVVGRP
jgi:hypothetical protein